MGTMAPDSSSRGTMMKFITMLNPCISRIMEAMARPRFTKAPAIKIMNSGVSRKPAKPENFSPAKNATAIKRKPCMSATL